MATVYKRTRKKAIPRGAELVTRKGKRVATWTDGKTGRKRKAPLNDAGDKIVVESDTYLISYYDENGRRVEVNSGTPDKDAAKQIAAKLETEVSLRKRGIIDATQERFAKEGQRLIAEHIAEFQAAQIAKDNTAKHIELTDARIRFIVAYCGAEHIKHLTASSVQLAIKAIRDNGRSLETCNCYLRAIKSFGRWLRRDKRLADDPLEMLQQYNAATDPRHVRRELTPEEINYLLRFVEGHTHRNHNLVGPDRAMAYRVALGTGFRANELRSLTPPSFDLDGETPSITVEAAYSKHRRKDIQPIRSDLGELLRSWLDERPRDARVFGKLPNSAARMLKKDMDSARLAWTKEAKTDNERKRREASDFLRHNNSAGEVVDFYATRHTYISGIVASGASVKTAQELARHSTPTLTIGRYAHTRLHDLRGALEALPDTTPKQPDGTEAAEHRATGTDNFVPANRQQYSGESCRNLAKSGEGERECDTQCDDDRDNPQVVRLPANRKKNRHSNKAEGMGLEPTTPYGAPHFQ